MNRRLTGSLFAFALATNAGSASAQDAGEMARKLQDPLAYIKALMTDNDVLFNSAASRNVSGTWTTSTSCGPTTMCRWAKSG